MNNKKDMTDNNTQLHIKLDFINIWKLLIDKQKKKGDLKRDAVISAASVARLNKVENVKTETLLSIYQYIECGIADICEVKQIKTEDKNI